MKNLFLAVLLISSVTQAKEFKGINFPDEVKVGATTLKLNGTAVRRVEYIITIYVAGMYLAASSKDGEAILNSDTPKQIIFHYKYGVEKNQIINALKEGFDKNKIDGYSYVDDFEKLKSGIVAMSSGDVGIVTFYKDHVDVQNKNLPITSIASANFSKQYLKVFLHTPPDEDVKAGLLGN